MTQKYIWLVPAGLMLAAFAVQNPEIIPRRTGALTDADARSVRSIKPAPVRIEETPLFRIDPRRPPAAMIADWGRAPTIREAPRAIEEEKPRR